MTTATVEIQKKETGTYVSKDIMLNLGKTHLPEVELRTALFISEMLKAYNDQHKILTINEIKNGYENSKGEIVVPGIGHCYHSIKRALKSLVKKGIILLYKTTKTFGEKIPLYLFTPKQKFKLIIEALEKGLISFSVFQRKFWFKKLDDLLPLLKKKNLNPNENSLQKDESELQNAETKFQENETRFQTHPPETIEKTSDTEPVYNKDFPNKNNANKNHQQTVNDVDDVEKNNENKKSLLTEDSEQKSESLQKDIQTDNCLDGTEGKSEGSAAGPGTVPGSDQAEKENNLVQQLASIKVYENQAKSYIKKYGYIKVLACLKAAKEEESAGKIQTDITRWFNGTLPKFEINEEDIKSQEEKKAAQEKMKTFLSDKNKKYMKAFSVGLKMPVTIKDWQDDLNNFASRWLRACKDKYSDPEKRAIDFLDERVYKLEGELRRDKLEFYGLSGKSEPESVEIIISRFIDYEDKKFDENLFKLSQLIDFEDLKALFNEAQSMNPEIKNIDMLELLLSEFKNKL